MAIKLPKAGHKTFISKEVGCGKKIYTKKFRFGFFLLSIFPLTTIKTSNMAAKSIPLRSEARMCSLGKAEGMRLCAVSTQLIN